MLCFKESSETYPNHSNEDAGIKNNGLYSVNYIRIACSSGNIAVLGSRQVFDERILLRFFLHDAFHFGVSQRSQKLILSQMLDNHPHIKLINKERAVNYS